MDRLDKALTLRQALSIDSDLPEVYVNLGTAFSRKGTGRRRLTRFEAPSG
jgi:hypothetical protein